jgi:hypothetical protein
MLTYGSLQIINCRRKITTGLQIGKQAAAIKHLKKMIQIKTSGGQPL